MGEVSSTSAVGGDLVLEIVSVGFNYESCKIVNPEASEITFPIGTPIIHATGAPVVAADIATATGITVRAETVAASESSVSKVPVLARGPAVVNKSVLPTTDYLDAAINMTNFAARLVALGMVVRTELAVQELQDT